MVYYTMNYSGIHIQMTEILKIKFIKREHNIFKKKCVTKKKKLCIIFVK